MAELMYTMLSARRLADRPLLDCPYVRISDNMRLWYAPRGEGNGFDFLVGRYFSATHDAQVSDLMGHPDTQVERVLHGIAYFDGVRHMYAGEEEDDDIYYPHLLDLIGALVALAALEHRLCWLVREQTTISSATDAYKAWFQEGVSIT